MTTNGPDPRRVDDLSAAELLEAAVERMAASGITSGQWLVELYLSDGRIRQARVRPPHVEHHASLGRTILDGLRGGGLGSPA
jgi:hypothetical protein